jgi:Cellulase (glycosyl hydrolase family 5)
LADITTTEPVTGTVSTTAATVSVPGQTISVTIPAQTVTIPAQTVQVTLTVENIIIPSQTDPVTGTAAIDLTTLAAAVAAILQPSPPPPSLPTVTTTSLPAATVGAAYSVFLTASGGVAPYSFIVSGQPAGIALAASNTELAGIPTASGSFSVQLSAVDSTGGVSAPVTLPMSVAAAVTPPAGTLSLKVVGNKIVDQNGNPFAVRGANAGTYLYNTINQAVPQGHTQPAVDPWNNFGGEDIPNLTAMKSWGLNTVRIALNESSLIQSTLGGFFYDSSFNAINADPSGNYLSDLVTFLNQVGAAGMAAIIDIEFSAPGRVLGDEENQQGNADNTPLAWKILGNAIKNMPWVIGESFNEPFNYGASAANPNAWTLLMTSGGYYQYFVSNTSTSINNTGGYKEVSVVGLSALSGTWTPGDTLTQGSVTAKLAWADMSGLRLMYQGSPGVFANGTVTGSSGGTATITNPNLGWKVSSHEDNIAAFRSTGAANIFLLSGQGYAGDLYDGPTENWLTDVAADVAPAGFAGTWTSQIGCAWHSYAPIMNLKACTIAAGGAGYAVNDYLILPYSLGNQAAQLTVTAVNGTAISAASVLIPGTGHHVDEVINLVPGSIKITNIKQAGSGGWGVQTTNYNPANGQIVVTSVTAAGGIATFEILNGGTGHAVGQTVLLPATWVTNGSAVGGENQVPPIVLQVTSIGTGGTITGVSIAQQSASSFVALPPTTQAIGQASAWSNETATIASAGTGATFFLTGWQYQLGGSATPANYQYPQAIAAKYPLIMTEFGSYSSPGCTGDPNDAMLLAMADAAGIGYTAWTFDASQEPTLLYNNSTSMPSEGYGLWYQRHCQRLAGLVT